jgi:hypothetical protein
MCGKFELLLSQVRHTKTIQDYRTAIPTPIDDATLQTTYNAKLWLIDKKIGQAPYEFPTVFSFFLPNYIPDSGPNLPAKLVRKIWYYWIHVSIKSESSQIIMYDIYFFPSLCRPRPSLS